MKTLVAITQAVTLGTYASLAVLSMINLINASSLTGILVRLACVVILVWATVGATVRRAREETKRDESIARLSLVQR